MDSKDLKKELEKMLEECGLNGEVIDLSNDNDKSEKKHKVNHSSIWSSFLQNK
ncbi:hypothetical protein [Faecalibacillus intestinalis]|uniref:hypothetical protein n=1 Tax=Faecalibacillus intestinalis TaxID=1982626 RepID=UPI00326748B6